MCIMYSMQTTISVYATVITYRINAMFSTVENNFIYIAYRRDIQTHESLTHTHINNFYYNYNKLN